MKCDTLVLIPGLMCDHRLFEHQIFGLANHLEVMVADNSMDDSIEDMAQGILDLVKGNFAVAGLSMGGYVALEILRRAPERVSHLALLDTNAHADLPAATKKRGQAIRLVEAGKFDEAIETFIETILGETAKSRESLKNIIRGMAKDLGKDCFIRQQRAIMQRKDQTGLLSKLDIPSLVLCGKEDALCSPATHRDMASRLPKADYYELSDCGHMASMERPNEVMVALLALLHR